MKELWPGHGISLPTALNVSDEAYHAETNYRVVRRPWESPTERGEYFQVIYPSGRIRKCSTLVGVIITCPMTTHGWVAVKGKK